MKSQDILPVVLSIIVIILVAILGKQSKLFVALNATMPLAFMVEVLVLAGARILLLLKILNTLPWNLSPESSVLCGWVFLGLAIYYLYAVLNPQWIHALGPLLGFLVYDLVLFGPLFARFGNLQPEHVRGQVAASIIIIFSAALGVYYLLVNPATRLGAGSKLRRT